MRCAGAIKGSCRETVLRREQSVLQAPTNSLGLSAHMLCVDFFFP